MENHANFDPSLLHRIESPICASLFRVDKTQALYNILLRYEALHRLINGAGQTAK
jgi:hypothetical protein